MFFLFSPQQLHNAQQFPTTLVLMSKCGDKCHNCLTLQFFFLTLDNVGKKNNTHTTDGLKKKYIVEPITDANLRVQLSRFVFLIDN